MIRPKKNPVKTQIEKLIFRKLFSSIYSNQLCMEVDKHSL